MKYQFIAALSLSLILMAEELPQNETRWFTGEIQHEGFPLLLRFPEKPDFDTFQKRFPLLVIVTHQFEKVNPSGLPEADYNDSLADMDQEIVHSFPEGIAVLVETFAGRRNYYIYTTADTSPDEAKKKISIRYPKAKLQWKTREDPDWRLIRMYAENYQIYENANP